MAKSGMNLKGAGNSHFEIDDATVLLMKTVQLLNTAFDFIIEAKEIIELLSNFPDIPDELDACYVEDNQGFAVCYYEYDFLVNPNTEFRVDFDFAVEFINLNIS